MVDPAFTREAIESLRPFIQHTVDDRINAMKAAGKQPEDLVEAFALPVPTRVKNYREICTIDRFEEQVAAGS